MKYIGALLVLLSVFLVREAESAAYPFFKVFTQTTPIYRGRADPIVDPGRTSQHSHKVFGASGFDLGTGKTVEQVYDDLVNSTCTTASITIDKSAYWIPDLYYQWPNGTFSLVPNGGLTVYYIGRSGTGAQQYPTYHPFPRGFRMLAGNPFVRSYGATTPEKGIQWACLSTSPLPEYHGFPTGHNCNNGLRAQVFFPQCWDGRLDTPNHKDHVAYPIENYNTGNCPASHPMRIMSVFYEILFDVSKFPHGTGPNQFVLAPGDPTGFGLHGDFLNGWDIPIFQQALLHPTCLSNSTNNGNNVRNCLPLKPFVKDTNPEQSCVLDEPIPNYEDIGLNHIIDHLPGNNPLSYGPAAAVPAFGSYAQTITPGVLRVLIQSRRNNLYLSSLNFREIVLAKTPASQVYYPEVFNFIPLGDGKWGIVTEGNHHWLSPASNNGGQPLIADRNSAGGWEQWRFEYTGASGPTVGGTLASIVSFTNNKYVQVREDGRLFASGTTVTVNEQFYIYDANAGVPDTRSPVPI